MSENLAADLARCRDWKSLRIETRLNVCVTCLVRARRFSPETQKRIFVSGLAAEFSGVGHVFLGEETRKALCGRMIRYRRPAGGCR